MEHKNANLLKRHAPTNWRVLNISELSTLIVGADDVEKTAYIVDDGTGEPTTYVLTNYDPPTWKPTVSGTGGGGGGAITYSTASPVPTTIGGIEAGKEYTNENIVNVINDLLFPYQYPAFTAFAVNGATIGNFEVGYTFPAGDKVFTWATSNVVNIKPNTVTLNGVTGLANDGTETQTPTGITKTAVSTHTFTISAENTKGQVFNRTIVLSWGMKRFWGVSTNMTLDDAGVLALTSEISATRVKTVTYDCTGGRYFYFAYPTAWGDLNNTKINSLTWNDWVLVKRDFINQYGVTIPFNIYRSFNLLNGTVTVVWG